jgi:hypothetical protein
MSGYSNSPDYGTGVIAGGTTSAGTNYVAWGSGASRTTVSYDESSDMKCEKAPESRPEPKRGEFRVSVCRSPKGRRVKLVGDGLDGLRPLFSAWADRLGKDLRVVLTGGMAPYEFYERPLVDMRVGPNTLVLFLSGDPKALEKSSVNPNEGAWRVGLDELQSRKAPEKLCSPEFPAYANIYDDRKTFIGRIEGKYVYTMLYIPEAEKALPDEKLPSGMVMRDRHQVASAPERIAPLIEHVLSQYQRIVGGYAREIRGEVTDSLFREFCGDSMRKRQKSLQDKIDSAMSEIRSLEKSLIEKSRAVRESQKEITLLGSGALDAELSKEVRMLLKLVDDGLYEKFKIRHGRIIGMSAPVTIEHEGKKYALGKFLVCIRQNGAIELRHETKTGASHPHLSTGSEHPCLGNMGSDIPKLIGMERYAMVFQIMHEWLHCYNVDSRHNKIEDCVRTPAVLQAFTPGEQATPVAPGVMPIRYDVEVIHAGPATPGQFLQKMEDVKSEVHKALGVPREALHDGPEAKTASEETLAETVKKHQAFTANVSEIEEVG